MSPAGSFNSRSAMVFCPDHWPVAQTENRTKTFGTVFVPGFPVRFPVPEFPDKANTNWTPNRRINLDIKYHLSIYMNNAELQCGVEDCRYLEWEPEKKMLENTSCLYFSNEEQLEHRYLLVYQTQYVSWIEQKMFPRSSFKSGIYWCGVLPPRNVLPILSYWKSRPLRDYQTFFQNFGVIQWKR